MCAWHNSKHVPTKPSSHQSYEVYFHPTEEETERFTDKYQKQNYS